MAKKKYVSPFVLLSTPGDDVVIGGGSGQSGQEAWLCDYEEWETMFKGEYDGSTYPMVPGTGGDDSSALIELYPEY